MMCILKAPMYYSEYNKRIMFKFEEQNTFLFKLHFFNHVHKNLHKNSTYYKYSKFF